MAFVPPQISRSSLRYFRSGLLGSVGRLLKSGCEAGRTIFFAHATLVHAAHHDWPQQIRKHGILHAAALLVVFGALLAGCSHPEPDLVTVTIDPAAVQRGRELAQGLAACGFCHGQNPEPGSPLAGGRDWADKFGAVKAANITPSASGVGAWTTNQILRATRAGVDRSGALLSPEVHRGFEWMSDEDALAIVSYLRSLAPIDQALDRRDVSFVDRNTTGFFDRAQEVKGYIPSISPHFEIEYGRYLTNHVARCQFCHNSQGSFLSDEQYLAGGKVIHTSLGDRTAPSILNDEIDGIGTWSEDQLIHYLETGEAADGHQVEPSVCPTGFYRTAPKPDLRAIAHYLKANAPAE